MKPLPRPLSNTRSRSPLLAALLSAILCGLGQVYNGRMLRGIILFVLMCILWGAGAFFGALTFGVGLLPFAIVAGVLWLFGVLDAYRGSRSLNQA